MKKIVEPLVYDVPIISKENLPLEKQRVLEVIGSGKRVLEVGCSTGGFTKHLRDQGCIVTSIEIDQKAAEKARHFAESVIVGDIEDPGVWLNLRYKFDIILFMHILEHLVDPWRVLCDAKNFINRDGFVIILIPNIACWEIRKQLFFKGRFQYQKFGVIDITHLRFFTFQTACNLILEAGYAIQEWDIVGKTVPLAGKLRRLPLVKYLAPTYEKILIRRCPNLCGATFFFRAVVK